MSTASPTARERLLAAAARCFTVDGIAATGIDRIVAEAGVAKMSLYNNFASKSELVLAYLAERHAEWLGLLAARDAAASSPEERVLAVFDAYLDHARPDVGRGFRGCGQLNTAAEFPAGDPARALVRRQKEEVEAILCERIAELDAAGAGTAPGAAGASAAAAGASAAAGGASAAAADADTATAAAASDGTAAALAEQLSLLLEGAVARAGLEETEDRLLRARAIAAGMLEHRLATPR